MRVLVCGGRRFGYNWVMSTISNKMWSRGTNKEELDLLNNSLNQLKLIPLFDLVIHGGATGADYWAGEWADGADIPCLIVPAPWSQKGKSAGIIRNLRMLDFMGLKPDLVVAFPGGNGTAHMVKIATEAGVALWQPQQHVELPSQLIDQLRILRDRA